MAIFYYELDLSWNDYLLLSCYLKMRQFKFTIILFRTFRFSICPRSWEIQIASSSHKFSRQAVSVLPDTATIKHPEKTIRKIKSTSPELTSGARYILKVGSHCTTHPKAYEVVSRGPRLQYSICSSSPTTAIDGLPNPHVPPSAWKTEGN
jgi:hypothetical protein